MLTGRSPVRDAEHSVRSRGDRRLRQTRGIWCSPSWIASPGAVATPEGSNPETNAGSASALPRDQGTRRKPSKPRCRGHDPETEVPPHDTQPGARIRPFVYCIAPHENLNVLNAPVSGDVIMSHPCNCHFAPLPALDELARPEVNAAGLSVHLGNASDR